MLWRVRNSRGRPKNAPAAFIHPCRPTVAKRPPRDTGWVHELKHDGYRLQIHIPRRTGAALYDECRRLVGLTRSLLKMPPGSRVPQSSTREVVCAGKDGVPDFDRLHAGLFDHLAGACAFDLLMLNGDDLRRKTFAERKAALRKLLKHEPNGTQYVEHTEGDGDAMLEAVCKLGLVGIVSKKLYAPYRSGPSKSWIKIKNPKSPAAMRVIDGTF